MAKDPVCGMMVDPQKAAAKSECKGKTYYSITVILIILLPAVDYG